MLCIHNSSTAAQKHLISYLSPYIILPDNPINSFWLSTLLTMKTLKENFKRRRKVMLLSSSVFQRESVFCSKYSLELCYMVDWREGLMCQHFLSQEQSCISFCFITACRLTGRIKYSVSGNTEIFVLLKVM